MQKQSFGLGLFSLTALRRTADLQGMLSAKTADLAPVVPVIALVELNGSTQPKPAFCTYTILAVAEPTPRRLSLQPHAQSPLHFLQADMS